MLQRTRNLAFQRTTNTVNQVERLQALDQEVRNLQLENQRVARTFLRDQLNPLESYSDHLFKQNFAFTKETFVNIYNIFKDELTVAPCNYGPYIPPILRFTIFMQYLRSNSFYRCVSTQCVVTAPESTVCRIVNQVAKTIAARHSTYVKFPDANQQDQIAQRIFEESKIPGVIGIADGTQIKISKPRFERDPLQQDKFFNRKGFHSWNALGIIDDQLKFIYFSCKYPGNAHDTRIYNESKLKATLQANFNPDRPRHLMGDKGYQLQNTMLTPVRADKIRNQADKLYNIAFGKMRVRVECSYGFLKKYFPALLYGLRKYKAINSQATVFTAIVLYNLGQ